MKSNHCFKAVVMAFSLPLVISGCSKQQDFTPTLPTVDITTGLSVANGRVVFANQQVFDQTMRALEQLGARADYSQAFEEWEGNLRFTSLRAVALKEGARLEKLDAQGVPTPAYRLLTSFGFPASYAAFINPVGEYQVGSKLYWYHEGFRYQADSQTELSAIKQEPSMSKAKFAAGSRTIKSGILSSKQASSVIVGTNTTVASSEPSADDRYSYYFTLPGDPSSKRRTIYSVNVYTADQGQYGYGERFDTNIQLQIKFEYYSDSRAKWYPAPETFFYQVNTNFSGSAAVPYQVSPAVSPTQNSTQNRSFSTGDGLYAFALGSARVEANVNRTNRSYTDVKWTFDINGTISGYAKSAPNNIYTVGYGPLW